MIWLRALIGTSNGWLAAILAALVAFITWTYSQRAIGRAQGSASVVSSITKQTDKTNAKVSQARRAAAAPGASDRVREKWCRDCTR